MNIHSVVQKICRYIKPCKRTARFKTQARLKNYSEELNYGYNS